MRECMNAIMHAGMNIDFEGVIQPRDIGFLRRFVDLGTLAFDDIHPPRDIDIRGDLSTSNYWHSRKFVHYGTLAFEEICPPRDIRF